MWCAAGIDTAVSGSNIYSVSECLLLSWLSFHFALAMPSLAETVKLTSFENDLHNGLVLAGRVTNHDETHRSCAVSVDSGPSITLASPGLDSVQDETSATQRHRHAGECRAGVPGLGADWVWLCRHPSCHSPGQRTRHAFAVSSACARKRTIIC